MNIFSKAAQGLNLTPAQRAFLKLLKLWFYTALSTSVMAGAQYLLNNQQVNWTALLYIAGGSFLLSILGALDKYWSAKGDAPLALLTEAGIQRVQQLTPPAAPAQVAQPAPQPAVLPAPTRQVPIVTTQGVQQVPFPAPVPNMTAGNPLTISFGDTGIVPTLPKQ